jgi:biopolymer transport protein ExbD
MDLYRRRRIDAHVDMTPMIDTLLQLFMIFLLSASFVASSVRLDLPKATVEQKAEAQNIVVSIDANNGVFLNTKPVARDQLGASLKPLLQQSKEPTVMLRADRKLLYEQVLDVMVDIRGSGATRVLLAYDPGK